MKQALFIFFVLLTLTNDAQRDTSKYDRKEEIIADDKRYRIHNNYLSVGFGFSHSTIRKVEQSTLGIDYTFHVKKQHFQAGILMSGNQFLSNNNLQGHLCYGYRIENEKYNIAFFAGISRDKGVVPPPSDSIPPFYYRYTGFYANVSYIHKLTYDIGIGLEGILEINSAQIFTGLKAIVFFSGAYRGKSKIYNMHVKRKRK